MEYPLVSIITVNYHRVDVTIQLLESLVRNPYPNMEVIVVDNDSKEDISEKLQVVLPEVQVIPTSSNLGFAGGNNVGIDAAKGEFLFFINNDAEVTANCIYKLVERLQSSVKIGGVSPKIKFHFNQKIIQYAGFTKIHPITGRNELIGYGKTDATEYNIAQETAYVHGAAMMVRKEVLVKAGKMPECYFLYYEELDWSQRIVNSGFQLFYEPAALVFHKESISTGKASKLQEFYKTRNRILFMYRNQQLLSFVVFFCYFLSALTVKKVIQKSTISLESVSSGIISALQNILTQKKGSIRFS